MNQDKGALVLEKNPFIRSTFLGLSTKLDCPLYIHDDPVRAVLCLRKNLVGAVIASRRMLSELDAAAAGEWMLVLQRQKPRLVITLTRGEPASLAGTQATISFRDGYPPMPPTEAGERLLALYSKASQDAGLGPIGAHDPGQRGAGDVQFAAPYTVGIDGLGAAGLGSHTDDESMEIASIERGAIRAAILIYRLIQP